MIQRAIALTRGISPLFERCQLTHLERQAIDLDLAAKQHRVYEETLEDLGCTVRRIDAEPGCPDSVFVEDTAVVLPEVAILTRPGAIRRRAEVDGVGEVLEAFRTVVRITEPATLDGGDVLRVGRTLLVGRTRRTNAEGVDQLARLVAPWGYAVVAVPIHACLHLKSAVCQAAERTVIVNSLWVDTSFFATLDVVHIHADEPFGANVLAVGDTVLMPHHHPRTRDILEKRDIKTRMLDVSELAKAEGGVTCCSLMVDR